jgi:uncharacterized protein GlcG (DUF336 family)
MKINKKWILGVIAIALCTSLTSQEAAVASSISQQQLTLSAALQAAQASIESCKSQGIAVSVSVVDSNGLIQVKLKDDDASPLSTRLSQRKAFTAANFRKDTTLLADLSDTAVGRSEGILMSAGGVLIKVDEVTYGAIGVSGSASGAKDDECAKAGLLAITDSLKQSPTTETEPKDDAEKDAAPKQ